LLKLLLVVLITKLFRAKDGWLQINLLRKLRSTL
jgi:hypothetical protein